jgi:hypothetical protein
MSMTPIAMGGYSEAQGKKWIKRLDGFMPGISKCMYLDVERDVCWIHDYVSTKHLYTSMDRRSSTD